MAKYVLNSGGLKSKPDTAKEYFAEVLEGLGETPKLLWCFFATLPDNPDERFTKYTKMFASYMPSGVHPIHKNAGIDTFAEDVAWADAIYIHGGHVSALRETLAEHDLSTIFSNKTVGTNSASSILMSAVGFDCYTRKPSKGLSIFPIKFIAHYGSDFGSDDSRGPIDWDAAYDTVKNYGDTSLPVHALYEGEFIVMEK